MRTEVVHLTRKQLYDEVWEISAMGVARKYDISYPQFLKQIKNAGIPVPPSGYWVKLNRGKPVEKATLEGAFDDVVVLVKDLSQLKKQKTESFQESTKEAPVHFETVSVPEEVMPPVQKTQAAEKAQKSAEVVDTAEERKVLTTIASQIRLPEETERMHAQIIAHRKVIAEWRKEEKRNAAPGRNIRSASTPPFLATEIAEDSVPRACRIIDALIKATEPSGCSLTEGLMFIVNGETVRIAFTESKDKVDHILTKEENRQMLKYEEDRKRYSFVSRPQIRKYDYVFNGRLCLTVNAQKSFRDCKSYRLEDRLGDILLELYIAAEDVRQKRLEREEAERKRQEEAQRREERRKRYNAEVDRTIALENMAEDYDMACKIRRYIEAHAAAHPDEDLSEWIAWANAKADWYDPTVARKDEWLGQRDHASEKSKKSLKPTGYWW